MNVLGIHYFAPPVAVVGARRLKLFYERLQAGQLHSVLGLTEDATVADIHLITAQRTLDWPAEPAYVHNWSLHHVAGRGLRERVGKSHTPVISTDLKKRNGYALAAALRNSFPLLYVTDEGGRTYANSAFQKAVELVEEHQITHLVSSYRPWADHLVAARLKKRFPHLTWWADFRDLPVDPVRQDVCWPGLQLHYARKIIGRADRLVAVSRGQAEQLAALGRPVAVVHNEQQQRQVTAACRRDKFIINYTGSIYPRLQSLAPLGKALRGLLALDESATPDKPGSRDLKPEPSLTKYLELHYAGKDGPFFREWAATYGLLPWCVIDRVVTQSDAQRRQEEAAINLLLSWSAPGYYGVLTAKLFDYLAAGRPILALVNGPADPELDEWVSDDGRGICLHEHSDSTHELTDWLLVRYQKWKKASIKAG